MSGNFLVSIGGPPASGKTTIAEKLSADFYLPLLRKDAIKELMFDCLGWSDRAWSKKLGETTYRIIDQFTEEELKAGRPVILEANFKKSFDEEKLRQWQKRYGIRFFQVFCNAPREILLKRFESRVESGERHPGHVDGTNYDIFEPENLAKSFTPLDVEGELIVVDSTKPFESYYPEIKEKFTRFKTGLV